jgi:tetratricopeptide (TPR) repeat protein/transcriptional regulator with XRE-family HTH domain
VKKNTSPNLQLKRARERQGWSQEYVAQEVGTDSFNVSRWERGISMPSPYFRRRLSELFSLSVTELGLIPGGEQSPDSEADQQDGAQPQPVAAQAPVLDPAIPPPLTRDNALVGRADLLNRLKQRLQSAGVGALLALNGLPGVGKTTLATALAYDEEVRRHFSGGILWVGLGYEPDVLGLLSHWGTALDCAPAELAQRSRAEAWAKSIHAAIGQRRMLLVIDDVWEIAEARAFQVGGPNCTHLLTTRFPEIARRFAVGGAIVINELEDADGLALLARLAPEAVQAEPEEARKLVSAVGNLPLALTLMGNFLREQAHSGQPRRVRAALERLRRTDQRLQLYEAQPLVGGHPGLSAGTPLSLQLVIGMSDQQVSQEARTALRALAVFPPKPNTFSEEAALAVSAMPVDALDELMDAGLLESSGPERYMLHQTIADYARSKLVDEAAIERLAEYFVAYVEAYPADYAALDSESNNILAALEAAYERGILPTLVRGAHAFSPLLITRGLYTVAETYLQRSLAATRTLGDDAGQATAWLHLGKIAEQRGNYVQAQAHWQSGMLAAQRSHAQRCEGFLLQGLGTLAWRHGQLQQARESLTRALEIVRQQEDQRGMGDILKGLGSLAHEQGQNEQGERFYEEALAVYRHQGDQRGIAAMLNNMGILARERGQLEQAREQYEESLALFRVLGDRFSRAVVLNNLGHLMRNQGQFERARECLSESLAMQGQLGNVRDIAFTQLNLGGLAAEQMQFEQARGYLNEALATFRTIGAQRDIALTVDGLGEVATYQGQFEQAREYLDEALALFLGIEDQRQCSLVRRDLGILARHQGQLEQARQLLNEALSTLVQLEDRREIGITRLELGILARQQGQLDEAQRLLMESLAAARQSQDRYHVACALKELGCLSEQQEQLEQAVSFLLRALVGLSLMNSPEMSAVAKHLKDLRAQIGANLFLSTVNAVINEAPETAYGLDQAAWSTAIRKLMTREVKKSG